MAEHKRKEWENQDGDSLVDGVASNDEEWGRKQLVLGGLGGGEQTVSGLSREGSSGPGDVEYFTGVWALYVGTEGTTHTVQIISVDRSLAPPSFLILLPDGTETTTEAANFQGVTEQPSRELVAGDVGDGVLGADGGAGFKASSTAVDEGGGFIKEVSQAGGVGAGHLGAGGGAGVGSEAAAAGAGEVGQQEPAPGEVEESLDSDEFLLAQMAAYEEDPDKYGIEARALFPHSRSVRGQSGQGGSY